MMWSVNAGKKWYVSTSIRRFPLAVIFGLSVAGPISLLSLLFGVTTALVLPVQHVQSPALDLIPAAARPSYIENLREVQISCFSLHEHVADCRIVALPSAAQTAVHNLVSLAQRSSLKNCHSVTLKTGDPFGQDLLLCSGPKQVSNILTVAWFLVGLVGLFTALYLIVTISSYRDSLPRVSPHLWLTPWASLCPLITIGPIIASVTLSWLRLSTHEAATTNLVKVAILWLSCVCFTIAAILVVDLKMPSPYRCYLRGLSILAAFLITLCSLFVLALSLVVGNSRPWIIAPLMAAIVFSAIVSFVLLRRLETAHLIRDATLRFFLLLGKLAWPILCCWIVLILRQFFGFTRWGRESFGLVAFLLFFHLAWSRACERVLLR